jgi:hypothetical protein
MSQMTQEKFLSDWEKTEGIPGARFGILNALETRDISIEGWPDRYSAQESTACVQFLAGVVRSGADGREGAKALQVLLKHLEPGISSRVLAGDYIVYREVMELICSLGRSNLVHRAPISTLVREFLEDYQETIWQRRVYQKNFDRRLYLKEWTRLLFISGNFDLLDTMSFDQELLSATIGILEQMLSVKMLQDDPPITISQLTRDQFTNWSRPIKAILYLKARNGDFDQLISLK